MGGNKIADSMAALKINELPRPKRKKVDVLAEFKKVEGKKSASFVVIGLCFQLTVAIRGLTFCRTCRPRQEYIDGQTIA